MLSSEQARRELAAIGDEDVAHVARQVEKRRFPRQRQLLVVTPLGMLQSHSHLLPRLRKLLKLRASLSHRSLGRLKRLLHEHHAEVRVHAFEELLHNPLGQRRLGRMLHDGLH